MNKALRLLGVAALLVLPGGLILVVGALMYRHARASLTRAGAFSGPPPMSSEELRRRLQSPPGPTTPTPPRPRSRYVN